MKYLIGSICYVPRKNLSKTVLLVFGLSHILKPLVARWCDNATVGHPCFRQAFFKSWLRACLGISLHVTSVSCDTIVNIGINHILTHQTFFYRALEEFRLARAGQTFLKNEETQKKNSSSTSCISLNIGSKDKKSLPNSSKFPMMKVKRKKSTEDKNDNVTASDNKKTQAAASRRPACSGRSWSVA